VLRQRGLCGCNASLKVDIFEIYTRVEKHVKQALLTYGIHMPRWKFWPLTVRIPKRTCAHVKSNVRLALGGHAGPLG
jgi:hypothetical protein